MIQQQINVCKSGHTYRFLKNILHTTIFAFVSQSISHNINHSSLMHSHSHPFHPHSTLTQTTYSLSSPCTHATRTQPHTRRALNSIAKCAFVEQRHNSGKRLKIPLSQSLVSGVLSLSIRDFRSSLQSLAMKMPRVYTDVLILLGDQRGNRINPPLHKFA